MNLQQWMDKKFPNGQIDYYELFNSEGAIPCHSDRFSVTDDFKTLEDIHTYIRLAKKDINNDNTGWILFSVTIRDRYHKLWLQAAKEVKGSVVMTAKSRHVGNYKCWMIWIPVSLRTSKLVKGTS